MKLSMEWLNNYVDLGQIDPVDFSEILSKTGLEVEGIENIGEDLSHLVVGEVVECSPLEESDHLNLTKVNVGQVELVQIVCGAPNIAAGQKVIVALPGAVLPGGFEIKESKLRGFDSNGMICSLQELGFSDNVVPKKYANGIYVLPTDAPAGADVVDYLKLNDPVLELDLTPNRADAMSVRGAVYEVGAVLDREINFNPEVDFETIEGNAMFESVSVEVADGSLSPHYQLRIIKNVTIQDSPAWMQMRLMKSGIRPTNNVVDVTNYFLLLYGQPMHTFDYDAVDSHRISVQEATEGDKFTTLDGTQRTLSSQDMLIVSEDTPIGLAGVMGGLDSEVTDSTTTVLLETARFNPERIRLTSKQFNLRSEASARYEKGINAATVEEAGDLAAGLIANLGGGQVVEGVAESKSEEVQNAEVTLNYLSIPNKLGIEMSREELEAIVTRLGFEAEYGEETFTVSVPPRRWDIKIEADMLEEIARIYGYENIPTTLPTGETTVGQLTKEQQLVRKTREISEGFGLNQVISYVLTSKEHAKLLASNDYPQVELLMPISEERAVLRQSIFPALMEIAQFNKARQNNDLAFYETGNVFFGQGKNVQPIEEERFAILLSGVKQSSTWYGKSETYDFYDIKGMVEAYFDAVGVHSEISYELTAKYAEMHPGRTAMIKVAGEEIGLVGQVHPTLAREYDLSDETFFMEMKMDAVLSNLQDMQIQSPIPRFPSSARDLALLVNDTTDHYELVSIIEDNGGEFLKSVELFDLYDGENIETGKKSLAYHLVFLNPQETMTDEVIDKAMTEISEALSKVEGLSIR